MASATPDTPGGGRSLLFMNAAGVPPSAMTVRRARLRATFRLMMRTTEEDIVRLSAQGSFHRERGSMITARTTGRSWARPICRPLRHSRGTTDCGMFVSDGRLGGKGGVWRRWPDEQEGTGLHPRRACPVPRLRPGRALGAPQPEPAPPLRVHSVPTPLAPRPLHTLRNLGDVATIVTFRAGHSAAAGNAAPPPPPGSRWPAALFQAAPRVGGWLRRASVCSRRARRSSARICQLSHNSQPTLARKRGVLTAVRHHGEVRRDLVTEGFRDGTSMSER